MTGVLFLGGILNRMFLGIPFYDWIMIGMILLGMLIGAAFFFLMWMKNTHYNKYFWTRIGFRYAPLFGVIPFVEYKGIGSMSLVFDENMKFDLITDRDSKVIFNQTFRQAQEDEGSNEIYPAATIGEVQTDFIFDPDKWTYPESRQHGIIMDAVENYEAIHEDDSVRTLPKFAQYLHNTHYPTDDNAPHFELDDVKGLKYEIIVPWSRIRMLYRMRNEGETFGFVGSLAKLISDIEKQNYTNIALVIFGSCILLDILMAVAWFVSKKP
jgi:hypothetical protein